MDSDELTMDHDEVVARRVVDRYLLGKLAPDESQRFERHYLTCEECLNELETTEHLVAGMRDAAAEDVARVAVGAGLAARFGRLRWLTAAAVAALIALPSAYLYRRLDTVDAELGSARTALAAARAPQAAVAVLPLNALRDGPSALGDPAPRRIRLGDAPGWVVLALELDRPVNAVYGVTLRDTAGAELWRGDDLPADAQGTVTLNVHSSTLATGGHTVEVRDSDGSPVASFRFDVVD